MEKRSDIPAWFAAELLKLFVGRHWGLPDPDLDIPTWWETLGDLPSECVVEGMRAARRQPGFITEGDVRGEAIRVARRNRAEIERRRLARALTAPVKPWTAREALEASRMLRQWRRPQIKAVE